MNNASADKPAGLPPLQYSREQLISDLAYLTVCYFRRTVAIAAESAEPSARGSQEVGIAAASCRPPESTDSAAT